ncbi:MAG TPA: hypothetical protein DCS83_01190 [Prevotella sp.]|nr:hypothetical protein [Prevotella sp.]
MIPQITQDNLYLLLPGKIVAVVSMYIKEHHVPALEALRQFYKSNTYKELERENTKLWHWGPVAIYQEYLDKK